MRLQKGFSIANTLGVLLGLLCLSAILTAYYFIHQARDNYFEKNIATLNSLQQLDAQWSAAILKTRSYTLQDFDQLAFYMRKIRQTLAELEQRGMLDIQSVGEKTVNQYQIYKNSFQVKNEAVERYKSQQAILRNSVRYLPTITETLQQILGDKNTLENKKLSDLVTASNLLINQFLLATVSTEKIEKKLAELAVQANKEEKGADKEDEINNKVDEYLTHAQLIVKHKPRATEMLNTAMANNIGELSTNVVDAYTQTQNKVKQRIKQLQQIMLASSVLLLAVMLWLLLRLRKSNAQIAVVDAEQKATHQQLLQAKEEIGVVSKNMLQAEHNTASGQLATSTLKQLHKIMPAFNEHLRVVNLLRAKPSLAEYDHQLQTLTADVKQVQHDLGELNTWLNPQGNMTKQIDFDFNRIIQKAIDVATLETDPSIDFTKQFSDIPIVQASPVDIFQVALKLFNQAIIAARSGDKNIFVKTWATNRYANMYIALSNHNDLEMLYAKEALTVVRELIEQNQGILKLTPQENDTSGMIWVSFPYTQ